MTDGWDKTSLEQLITVVDAVMPHPEAQQVIAICLMKAGLFAMGQTLDGLVIQMHEDKEAPWNATTALFSINGTEMQMEVRSV